MAKEFVLTEQMTAQIGAESPPWPFEVTTTSVRAFARGVGYTDPVYFDVAAAIKAGYRSLPAPPTYIGTPVFIPGRSSDTFSGPSEGMPNVDHGLKGILDGGTETETYDTICAGDELSAVTRIAALDVRPSKALGKMLVMGTETEYRNAAGDLVAKQRAQVIYY